MKLGIAGEHHKLPAWYQAGRVCDCARLWTDSELQQTTQRRSRQASKRERDTHTPCLLRVATHDNTKPNHQQKNWKKPKRKRQQKRVEIATKYLEPWSNFCCKTHTHTKRHRRGCVQGKLAKSLTLLQGVYASRSFLLISNSNKFSSLLLYLSRASDVYFLYLLLTKLGSRKVYYWLASEPGRESGHCTKREKKLHRFFWKP